MTKIFKDIIPIDGGDVVVDKEAPFKEGDWFYMEGDSSSWAVGLRQVEKGAIILGHSKIIASINKTIEGIPCIVLGDEVNRLAEECAKVYHYPDAIAKGLRDKDNEYYDEVHTTMNIFKEGYKAANKQYSEEEVIQLIWKALELDKIGKWEHHDANKVHVKAFIQSLQTKKIIAAVELEYEEFACPHKVGYCFEGCLGGCLKLKVTKENTIIPVKIHYNGTD